MNIPFKQWLPKKETVPKKPVRHVYHWWFVLVLTAAFLFVFAVSLHSFIFWRAVKGSLFSSSPNTSGEISGGLNRVKLGEVLTELERLAVTEQGILTNPPTIESLGTPALK